MTWPPTTHQDVEDDLTNGHGWAGSLLERFGIGDQLVPTPFVWIAGNYYGSGGNALATINAVAPANRLILTPIYFPTSKSVDQIAVNVGTAGTASHVARLGIYNSSTSTGLPTTVKVDAGTVAVDSSGVKTLTVSTTLTGLYWLAATSQSGSMTSVNNGGALIVGGMSSASAASSTCLARNSTVPTSALPDLTGDGTVAGAALSPIRVVLRAA